MSLIKPRLHERTTPGRTFAPAESWPPERLLRLFACGCCRQWDAELAPACRRALDVAERYADGRCPVAELEAAWRACRDAERRGLPDAPAARTTEHVHRVASAVFTPADAELVATDLRPWRGVSGDNDAVDALCARVWSDVFGGSRTVFDRLWLTAPVRALARRMYESGEFSAMPILADALQGAGCEREAILAYCRDGGRPHVRGCWVVDRILHAR